MTMSKNFWKMATIGLAGYVIGREVRLHYPRFAMARQRSKKIDKLIRSVTFESKDTAMIVLNRMKEILNTYGKCRVSDFYSSAEVMPPTICSNLVLESNGWYDLSDSQPIMNWKGKWILELPKSQNMYVRYCY